MTKDEALKLAMEKFEFMNHVDSIFEGEFDFQINAIKEALAQPEHDYKDLYEKEKRRSAMWLSKYEEVAGPAPKAIPMAQPEQEPVAWMCADESLINKGYARFSHVCMGDWKIPVYTTPPQRKPLTNEEITQAFNKAMAERPKDASNAETNRLFVRAIEAAHGIKGEA